jgi:hypothetical protein
MRSKAIVFIIFSGFLVATAIGMAELIFRTRAMRAEAESMASRKADLGEYKNKFGRPIKLNLTRSEWPFWLEAGARGGIVPVERKVDVFKFPYEGIPFFQVFVICSENTDEVLVSLVH